MEGKRGETDWKLLAVPATEEAWDNHRTLEDIPTASVDGLREWFANYKVAEGKPPNTFAFGGVPVRTCSFYLPLPLPPTLDLLLLNR